MIKFDLSTYTGRTVNLAQLRVRCTAGNNTMQWAGVKSHDWSEGNKNGTYPAPTPRPPASASPIPTARRSTPPVPWAGAAASNAYLDFTSNGADLYAATNFTSYPGGAAWAVADVTSLVQDWLSGTKANYGVVLLQGNHPVNMSEIGTDYEPVLFLDVAGGDTTAPAAVTNLATSSPTTNSITLTWTAPGDDGSTGTATTYDIRYRTGGAVNDSNWASATQVTGEPTPAAAGTNQSMVVNGLLAGTTYYFAIKTSDEVPNTSAISNSPSGTTTSAAVTVALKRDSGLLQGGAIDARFSGLSSATLVTVNDAKLYNSGNARYYNYGTSTLADQSYSVIKFDLSAYTGRTVNLAQLRVRCTAGNITMQWAGVKSHDWSEGNKNGNYPGISPSAPGVSVAHPNGTHTDTTGPLGWGSGSNAMLDFTSNGQDLYAVTNFTSYPGGVAWAVADLTSLVQEWLSGTKANYGVLLLEGNHPVNMSEIGTDFEPVLFLDLN